MKRAGLTLLLLVAALGVSARAQYQHIQQTIYGMD